MLSYHNDPDLKAKTVERIAAHRAADDLERGTYGRRAGPNGWRGCAVGCLMHSYDAPHLKFPSRLGWPVWLALLVDHLFERQSLPRAFDWPQRIVEAVPVGVDLDAACVKERFLLRMLADKKHGTLLLCDEEGKAATSDVIRLLRRKIAGKEVTIEQWQQVEQMSRSAAYAAYAAYADDAADAAFAASAAAEAYAAEAYAAYAADDAFAAYAADDDAHADWMADCLIEIILREDKAQNVTVGYCRRAKAALEGEG